MNDFVCPVVHKLNDSRVVMAAVQNIRFVQAVVGRETFVTVFFHLFLTQNRLNHSILQYVVILFVQAVQSKMSWDEEISLSPLDFLEQPRRYNIDVCVQINAFFVIWKELMRQNFMPPGVANDV